MDSEINRAKMLMGQIRSLSFAVNDLALYLDTHPCDQNALKCHREFSEQLQDAKQLYQSEYGPLTINDPMQNGWEWIESPWPWERGGI